MARAVLVVVVALLLSACSTSGAGPPQTAVPDVSGVEGVLSQLRTDTDKRRFRVKVRQPEGEPLHLTTMTVDVPGFAGPSRSRPDTRTFPGGAVDLAVDLGEVLCDVDPAGEPVTAELVFEGVPEPLRLVVPDPTDLVVGQHADECAAETVAQAAALTWGTRWRVEADSAGRLVSRGELVLGPVTGSDPVTVIELGGTVLLTPETEEGAVPATAAPGAELRLPVALRPTRCDPHVVAEGLPHRGYQLYVRVQVGTSEPVAVTVPVTDEASRTFLLDTFLEECGLG